MRAIAGLLCAVLGLASGAQAQPTIIHAGHLLAEPGKGVRSNQSILIEKGKVVAIVDGFAPGADIIDLKDAWVMPGLIDMHVHVTAPPTLGKDFRAVFWRLYLGRPAANVLASLPRTKALLMNGFTTVRALGDQSSTTYDLRDAIARGDVVGPRILGIEPQISVAGGDYDASAQELKTELEPFVLNRGNCSGAPDCARVVREEARRGADVIKLREAATPFLDPAVEAVEFREEVEAIVSTAHKLNLTVAVHVNGTPAGVRMAVEAGADTIEHGPVDEAGIKLMKARGTAFTPTLIAGKVWREGVKDLARYGGKDFHQIGQEATRKAYQAGVPILYGSDLGAVSIERQNDEFAELVAAGLPPEQAVKAATVNAAAKLGSRGAALGVIASGKVADIVAVRRDPTADISAMKSVMFVMKGGLVVKDDSRIPGAGH